MRIPPPAFTGETTRDALAVLDTCLQYNLVYALQALC